MSDATMTIVTYLRRESDGEVTVVQSDISDVIQTQVWEEVDKARKNAPGTPRTYDDWAAFLFGLGTVVNMELLKQSPGRYLIIRVAVVGGPCRLGSHIEIRDANIPVEKILLYEGHNLNHRESHTAH